MRDQDYILISRFLSGEATAAESNQLEKWLNETEENRQVFNKLEKLWQNAPTPQPDSVPSFEQVWHEIEDDLEVKAPQVSKAGFARSKETFRHKMAAFFNLQPFRVRYALAAVVLLLFTGTFLYYQFVFKNVEWQLYATQFAEKKSIVLPDGSQVKLNADSQIRFQNKFTGSERMVFFDGQAFFEVQPDGRPFIIRTGNAQIVVVGTSFDVRSRNQETQLVVKSGLVRFLAKSGADENSVLVRQNEMSVCRENRAPSLPVSIDTDQYLGWLQNKLVFDKTPLHEIGAELERLYAIKIKFSDPSISGLELTGEFDAQQPGEEIISLICLALDLEYHIEDGIYVITR